MGISFRIPRGAFYNGKFRSPFHTQWFRPEKIWLRLRSNMRFGNAPKRLSTSTSIIHKLLSTQNSDVESIL